MQELSIILVSIILWQPVQVVRLSICKPRQFCPYLLSQWQALETIKKLRKDKAQEVKEFKLKLDHLNTNKNSAHKLRTEVEQSTRRKAELEQQISSLQEQIQQHTEVNLQH